MSSDNDDYQTNAGVTENSIESSSNPELVVSKSGIPIPKTSNSRINDSLSEMVVSEGTPTAVTVGSGPGDTVLKVTPKMVYDILVSEVFDVPINSFQLTTAGLPNCGKSKLLHEVVSTLHTETNTAEGNGISYYGIVAFGTPISTSQLPKYATAANSSCYLSALEFALKYYFSRKGKSIYKYDLSALKDACFFDDKALDEHFHDVLESLDKSHCSSQFGDTIPNSLALLNIWDIQVNKAVFHFLPSLWGHLDRNILWLFLDLDRDANKLYEIPEFGTQDENDAKRSNDKEHVMKYRTRLHYFLRYVLLVKSKKKEKNRENVCTIFGIHNQKRECNRKKLKDEITNAAIQMGVEKSIDSDIKHLLRDNADALAGELDYLVTKQVNLQNTVPFRFLFLRSFLYQLNTLYITEDELKKKAIELGISDMKHFRCIFMSGGSIIDMKMIDPTSPYIILNPIQFMHEINKLFYPNPDTNTQVTEYGLVSEETAEAIFDEDYEFFMDVLVSVDLAIKLSSSQISIEGEAPSCSQYYYYVPDVCVNPPDLNCDPSVLHLLLNVNCPLSHLQIMFAKAFFDYRKQSVLVLEKNMPVNITKFSATLADGVNNCKFQLKYLGDAIEFQMPVATSLANETICIDIIKACNRMMKKEDWLKTKYHFAVMCSENRNDSDANRLRRARHILPSSGLCHVCTTSGKQQLQLWKTAIEQEKVPKDRMLNGGLMTISDICYVAENLSKLNTEVLNNLARKLDVAQELDALSKGSGITSEYVGSEIDIQSCSENEEDKTTLWILMEWEKKLKRKHEASKKHLARIFIELANSTIDENDQEILKAAARRLDTQVTEVS